MSRDLSLGNEIRIKFSVYEPEHEEVILTLLGQVLSYLHLNYLENILATIINELINNASKANIKRIFFKKSSLSIDKPEEYQLLIKKFKEEAVIKLKSYVKDLDEEGLYIQFSMKLDKDGIRIAVENNVSMTAEEESRAQSRLANAYKLNSMAEAFETFSDDDEGAGLGIILNIQLLKNANVDPENFTLSSDGRSTFAKIFIPSHINNPEKLHAIHKRIKEEIIELPIISHDTKALLEYTNNSDYSVKQMIGYLDSDPGLCSEIVREAGILSMGANTFDSLEDAVNYLGKAGLYQVISTCESRRIMESRYKDFKLFWGQSRRCGYYVRRIANDLNLDVMVERLYLAGIFHNLGKLIIFSLQPHMKNALVNTTMEEINMGISNSQVGAMVAEKWGYSKDLVSLLKNYLRPMSSPDNLRLETCVMHVADFMIKSLQPMENFIYLDIHAASLLGFDSKSKLIEFKKTLDKDFWES